MNPTFTDPGPRGGYTDFDHLSSSLIIQKKYSDECFNTERMCFWERVKVCQILKRPQSLPKSTRGLIDPHFTHKQLMNGRMKSKCKLVIIFHPIWPQCKAVRYNPKVCVLYFISTALNINDTLQKGNTLSNYRWFSFTDKHDLVNMICVAIYGYWRNCDIMMLI